MTDEERKVMRDYYDRRGKAFYDRYYGQLEGVVIQKYLGMDEDEYGNSPFPKFQLKYPSGEVLTMQISQDEEGNGGGFIFLPYEPVMDDFDAEKAELGITV